MIMALEHRFKLPQALCSNTVTSSRGSYSKGKKKVVSLQYSSVGESGEPAIFLTGEFLASVLQTWLNVGRHQPHPLSVPVTMQGLCEPDALQTGPPSLHIYVSPIQPSTNHRPQQLRKSHQVNKSNNENISECANRIY